MSIPVTWIRNNMLSSDEYGRQLTDAELRVQRSLQNLSIPEWYLNKRSNPPKILNNTPIDVRPPSWKNLDWQRTSVTNSNNLSTSDAASSKSPEISESNNPSTGTYKIQRRQKSPNSEQQESASTVTERMDTTIPHIKSRLDISKTFPKMSPSRKLQNINIVLARGPPLDLSHLEKDPDVSNRNTYIIIKRKKSAKKTNDDSSKSTEDSDSECARRETSSPNKQQEDNAQPAEPLQTPKRNNSFRVRAASTPKFSPTSLFSSTILEESPKGKRAPSKNILDKLSIFEDSWKDTLTSGDCEKASQSMQDRTSTLKSAWHEKPLSVSYEETPKASQRLQNLLERNIRSVEPIIFDSVDSLKSPTKVQEIVKKVESMNISESTPVKRSTLERKKSMVPAESKDLGESSKTPVQPKKEAESPSARSQNSRRTSMIPEELKNIGESSKTPVQPREKKDAESPSASSRKPRRISMIPKELKIIGEFPMTLAQRRNHTECSCDKSYNFRKMAVIPEESTNIEEPPMTATQLRKDVESPSTRSNNSRRMSIVPEELKNTGDSSKSPVQLKKGAESPCAGSHNSRRMSMIPEELKNIGESSKTLVQPRKDAKYPSTRTHNSRRMSMVPEELKNIGDSSKSPVQLKKDAESPCAGSHNSRRMSMIPDELKNIGKSSNTSVQQRKETLEKDAESPKTRFPKSRRMSIIPQELKDLRDISRILMQQRKEMEKEGVDSSVTRLLNSRRASLASPEFKNMVESSKTLVQQRETTDPETNANSPSTRFLNSRRKSMELENVVRSKQPPKQKSVVREIIEAMTERAVKKMSSQNQSNVPEAHQNFVRTMVDAMEKGNSSLLDETIQESCTSTIRNEDDLGSGSESDVKSSVKTMSSKDTESGSDSDQRSPVLLESDDNNKTFDFDTASLGTSKASEQKQRQDDDSVYWIPVSRCKLPRSSSLLSMMSRLSNNTDVSPCVSPIRSDSENENGHSPWGATFRKYDGLSRKFFRIDETIVIDSGYSDKSDKSAVACLTTDSNWSEDTQYESSGPEVSGNRISRASRRRSGIGATFRVSKF